MLTAKSDGRLSVRFVFRELFLFFLKPSGLRYQHHIIFINFVAGRRLCEDVRVIFKPHAFLKPCGERRREISFHTQGLSESKAWLKRLLAPFGSGIVSSVRVPSRSTA